jgi:DNA sulfur modification protein DndB
MATLIPAIKAKLGNTEYFESTMKVRDLVQAVRPPKEMDTWANLGIEERMQRDPDIKRIKSQLVPYLVRNPDRFFGSISRPCPSSRRMCPPPTSISPSRSVSSPSTAAR